MNDFENRIKELLNEQIDAQVGERRPAPGFDRAVAKSTPGRAGRRGGRWMMPLLAAACVAVVVGATAGASALLADDKHNTPATQVPNPTVPVTHVPSPTTPTTHVPSRTVPAPHMVTLAGASISVPTGWAVTAMAGDASANGPAQHWCLHPSGTSSTVCPLLFSTVAAPHPVDSDFTAIEVDKEGYGTGDAPQYCAPEQPQVVEQTGDRSFGGRGADWRRWDRTCPSGQQFHAEQYVVATEPGFALFSENADAAVQAAMTEIAAQSSLPAQTAPLRFTDTGILRTVDRTSGAVRITIDRVVKVLDNGTQRIVNQNPATYAYSVPTTLFDSASATVGTRVVIGTDGNRVLVFGKDT